MKVLRTASLGSSFASSYKKRVYFSHNMTKVTSQNEVKAFVKTYARHLTRVNFSNTSCVTPCVTSATFSLRDSFSI